MATVDQVNNFGKVTVSTGYSAGATSIVLVTGQGAILPATSGGAYNLVWFNSTDYPDPSDDPNVEIVRCTTRSTDTLTVTRAQEGTSASSKNTAGKTYKMILGPTAKTINDLVTYIATPANPQIPTGTINGSNTTFTATGKINVAFADSVLDVTAVLSYNSGTGNTTITTSVPPQNNVYAI